MGSQLTSTHSRGKEGQPWASGQGESSQGSKSTTVSVLTCSTVAMSTHSMIMLSVIVLHFSSLTLACKPASEKTPTEEDSGLLITGGYTPEGRTASTEVFPSCSSPPPLSLPRVGHQTFKTSDPTPLIASCGGRTGGDNTPTASCLVLDLENQRWDESRMGSLTTPRRYGAVVELKQGVLFLGGYGSATSKTTSDFLATGSLQWQQGPRLPQGMADFCAVPVSSTKFLTINGDEIHEFDAAIAGPTSEEGWRDSTLWPTLETSRYDHSCAKHGNKVILAGGDGGRGNLQSTLVLDITTRTISTGGYMASHGSWFNLATISRGGGEITFAIAGQSSSRTFSNSVEEWEEESSTWKAAGNLDVDTVRSAFGVVTIPKNIICPT